MRSRTIRTVFAFLTDPEKILRRTGIETTLDPHPAGLYLLNVCGKHGRGQSTKVIPVLPPRLQLRLGGARKGAAGIKLIEIDLIDQKGGTLVRLPIVVCRTQRNAPATGWVGRITSKGWPWPHPAAIQAPTCLHRTNRRAGTLTPTNISASLCSTLSESTLILRSIL